MTFHASASYISSVPHVFRGLQLDFVLSISHYLVGTHKPPVSHVDNARSIWDLNPHPLP